MPPNAESSPDDLANSGPRLVIHVDDVGMCHGANMAFIELSGRGAVSAGSVMVPCPWSSEILDVVADDHTLDLGVHLTLNAEQRHYRWRPVAQHPPSAGLVDDDGYMWRTVAEVRAHAHPEAVEHEWRAQIDRALQAGVDITHLDTHMGSALAPEWCDRYVRLGAEYRIPVLITSTLSAYGPHRHLGNVDPGLFAEFVTAARAVNQPIFSRVIETDFSRPAGTPVDYRSLFSTGTDDLSGHDLVYAALHPCRPGPGEIEVIEPDQHHVRTDEYEAFRDPTWTDWLRLRTAEGAFDVVTMRQIRDIAR